MPNLESPPPPGGTSSAICRPAFPFNARVEFPIRKAESQHANTHGRFPSIPSHGIRGDLAVRERKGEESGEGEDRNAIRRCGVAGGGEESAAEAKLRFFSGIA